MAFLETNMETTEQFYSYINGQYIPFTVEENEAHVQFVELCKQHRQDTAWASLRQTRNQLLTDSDWIIARCMEELKDIPADVVAYRKALRAITSNLNNPEDVIWPEKPAILEKSYVLHPPTPDFPFTSAPVSTEETESTV
jgi:predicted dienelactone hydrolase